MTTSFPTALDTFSNPSASDATNNLTTPHAAQHANANDAIEAIEAKIGTGASTPIVNRLLRGTGTGTSSWAQVAAGDYAAGSIVNADISASAAITPDKLIGPLFSYLRSATVNNVTGNGTVYTCVYNSAVISNANFNTTTGIFTAPVAGKYLLVCHVSMVAGDSSATQGVVQIVTTSQSFRFDLNPYSNRHTGSGVTTATIAAIASLASSDTAKITLAITGSGSDTSSFVGGSGFSSFAGWRVG